MSEHEKNTLINESSGTWTYEGVAWHAWNFVEWPTTF